MTSNVTPIVPIFAIVSVVLSSCSSKLHNGGYSFSTKTSSNEQFLPGDLGESHSRGGLKVYPVKSTKGFDVYLPHFNDGPEISEKQAIEVILSRKIPDHDAAWIFNAIVHPNFRSMTRYKIDTHIAQINEDRNTFRKLKSLGKRGRVITAVLLAFDQNLISANRLGTNGKLESLGLRIPIRMGNGNYQNQLIRHEDMRVIGYRYAKPTWTKTGALMTLKPDNEWSFCRPIQFPQGPAFLTATK